MPITGITWRDGEGYDVHLLRGMQSAPARRDAVGRVAYQSYLDRWSERAVVPRYLELIEEAQERRRGSSAHTLTARKA